MVCTEKKPVVRRIQGVDILGNKSVSSKTLFRF